VPDPLYVEGTIASSTTDDVELNLRYVTGSWSGSPKAVHFTIKPDAGNTPAQATEIDITKPIFEAVGPADPEDWYKFTVDSGGLFSIELGFDDPNANLDWYVFSTSDTTNPVASGNTSTNPEVAVAGLSPGQYYLQVVDVGSLTAPCSFTVTTTKTLTLNVDIDVDSDRSGSVEGTPTEENLEEQQTAIVPVNCDDDDRDGQRDCDNTTIESGDTDLVEVVLQQCAIPSAYSAFFGVVGSYGNNCNIFDNAGVRIIGPGGANTYTLTEADKTALAAGPLTFRIEATQFASPDHTEFEIRFFVVWGSEGPVIWDRVKMRPSPFVLLAGTEPSSEVYATDHQSGFPNAVGATVTIPKAIYDDRWVQDEMEIGFTSWPASAPGGVRWMHVVWNLDRNRGLDAWVRTLLGQDMGHFEGGGYAEGGDVELIPGGIANQHGQHGEHGVVITGYTSSIGPFIHAQGVQCLDAGYSIVKCDTSWLSVGHIDEIFSFLPSDKVAIADPQSAADILAMYVTEDAGGPSANISATSTSLRHSGKTWTTDQWANGFIEINSGAGSGQVRRIASNTADTINIYAANPWDTLPGQDSHYELISQSAYTMMFLDTGGEWSCGVVTEQTTDDWSFVDVTQNWALPTDWWWYVTIVDGKGAGQMKQVYRMEDYLGKRCKVIMNERWEDNKHPDKTSRYIVFRAPKNFGYPPNQFPACTPVITALNWHRDQLDYQDDIDGARETFQIYIGSQWPDDFVKIPAIFIEDPAPDRSGAMAWLPSVVNMLIKDQSLTTATTFAFLNSTPFETLSDTSYIDDWPQYHCYGGGVHCGTNVKRAVTNPKWW
jgi:hypothetical protein